MGASSASCCLNRLPPPPATSSSSPNLPSSYPAAQLPWFKSDKLRSHCVMGMACMVIGLETAGGNWTPATVEGSMSFGVAAGGAGDVFDQKVTAGGNKKLKRGPPVPRWSDKRMCPSWQVNSLETIVPENLPRPSASRRWEAVGEVDGGTRDSPAVGGGGVGVRRGGRLGSCFSM